MLWETLPNWVWALYYMFLLTTLGMAIFSVVKKKHMMFSCVAIVYTFIIPIVSLINSIGRAVGMNEFEHLVSELQQGAIWSIFAFFGYLFLLVWWVIFLFKSKDSNKVIASN